MSKRALEQLEKQSIKAIKKAEKKRNKGPKLPSFIEEYKDRYSYRKI